VITELLRLDGSTALVVGAGGDLGRRSAEVLGQLGARVIVADYEGALENLEATVASLKSLDVEVDSMLCDVCNEDDVTDLVAFANARGDLKVLVNAAGVMLRKPAVETTLEEWRHVIDVNLTGTWLLNRATAAVMAAGGGGKIVNIATVYAERVGPVPESAYYASKAGVANLTRSMASEFGREGVHVNCLALGVFYPTNMTAPLSGNPEMLAWMTERTLLKRLGDPKIDLDGPIMMLATGAASYMTGQVVYYDGGWSAW
jgi:gluconate 5-dehydrogenase